MSKYPYPELGRHMTDYGKERLRKGLQVSASHDHEYMLIQIMEDGDVVLQEGWATFRINKDFRQMLADSLLVKRDAGPPPEEETP